jgi:hypothetical protein
MLPLNPLSAKEKHKAVRPKGPAVSLCLFEHLEFVRVNVPSGGIEGKGKMLPRSACCKV